MDSLFLLQFACFIFMFINAFIVALSCLHVRWKNKRYERSRWMIAAAITGLAIQYVIQMKFGFRAIDDDLGAVINILVYTPCFSLICMGIYNLETTRANRRKMLETMAATDMLPYVRYSRASIFILCLPVLTDADSVWLEVVEILSMAFMVSSFACSMPPTLWVIFSTSSASLLTC